MICLSCRKGAAHQPSRREAARKLKNIVKKLQKKTFLKIKNYLNYSDQQTATVILISRKQEPHVTMVIEDLFTAFLRFPQRNLASTFSSLICFIPRSNVKVIRVCRRQIPLCEYVCVRTLCVCGTLSVPGGGIGRSGEVEGERTRVGIC